MRPEFEVLLWVSTHASETGEAAFGLTVLKCKTIYDSDAEKLINLFLLKSKGTKLFLEPLALGLRSHTKKLFSYIKLELDATIKQNISTKLHTFFGFF